MNKITSTAPRNLWDTLPDFTELGVCYLDGIGLPAREHQVIAMLAYGYSDAIIAEHLKISVKHVQAAIYALQRKGGWESREQMGRAYAALLDGDKSGNSRIVPVTKENDAVKKTGENGHGPTKTDERVKKIATALTRETVTRWYNDLYLRDGRSPEWIAKNNGIIVISGRTMRNYFKKFGYPMRKKRAKVKPMQFHSTPEEEEEFYLTPPQAAERAGVSAETIRRWCRNGDLPYITIGGDGMAIAPADLQALVASLQPQSANGQTANETSETAVVAVAPAAAVPATAQQLAVSTSSVAGELTELEAVVARLRQLGATVNLTLDIHLKIEREL